MNTSIFALLPHHSKIKMVTLFGYTTKGIPGLEIVGLGNEGRKLKEKFIFICRDWGIQLPLRRFVLCFEGDYKQFQKDQSLKSLELPLFILFLSLSQNLPISKLEDCLSFGEVRVDGQIIQAKIPKQYWAGLDHVLQKKKMKLKVISPEFSHPSSQIHHLHLEQLFADLRVSH